MKLSLQYCSLAPRWCQINTFILFDSERVHWNRTNSRSNIRTSKWHIPYFLPVWTSHRYCTTALKWEYRYYSLHQGHLFISDLMYSFSKSTVTDNDTIYCDLDICSPQGVTSEINIKVTHLKRSRHFVLSTVAKALKCWAFSNISVICMISRERERERETIVQMTTIGWIGKELH